MTLDQFTRLLDTFGADLRRWPDASRNAGEVLRDAMPIARERWEKARRLDALFALDSERLDRTCDVTPDRIAAMTNAALRRIRAIPERTFDLRWLLSKPVRAALAATLLAGWVAGLVIGPEPQPQQAEGVPAIAALLGFDVVGVEELL